MVGQGKVSWTIRDVTGNTRIVETTALYVPDATVRIFSPQSYFQENKQGSLMLNKFGTTLTLADQSTLQFPYQLHNNLPVMFTPEGLNANVNMISMTKNDLEVINKIPDWTVFLNNTENGNLNLKPAQKELLMLHTKLYHADMQRIQSLTVDSVDEGPILLTKHPKVSSCMRPLCATCQIANQGRRSPEVATKIPTRSNVLRANDLEPGAMTSTDQYLSSVLGRLPYTKGKEKRSKKFTGGTIFYDHASQLIYVAHQVSI